VGLIMAYDIFFRGVPEDEVRGFRTFTFGYEASVKISGAWALVDRWLKTFMTQKGSDPLDPNYGTSFPTLVGGNMSDVSSAEDAVYVALSDANDQVKTQDIESMSPPEERLQNAYLLSIRSSDGKDGLVIWVRISNEAGTSIPVQVAPQGVDR